MGGNARGTRLGDNQYGPSAVGGEELGGFLLPVSLTVMQQRKMPSPQNFRRLVLTAAVTSITIAGSLYGAGLKTDEEIAEVSCAELPLSSDQSIQLSLDNLGAYLAYFFHRPRRNARRRPLTSKWPLFKECART